MLFFLFLSSCLIQHLNPFTFTLQYTLSDVLILKLLNLLFHLSQPFFQIINLPLQLVSVPQILTEALTTVIIRTLK